jgi:hypothetical protein
VTARAKGIENFQQTFQYAKMANRVIKHLEEQITFSRILPNRVNPEKFPKTLYLAKNIFLAPKHVKRKISIATEKISPLLNLLVSDVLRNGNRP